MNGQETPPRLRELLHQAVCDAILDHSSRNRVGLDVDAVADSVVDALTACDVAEVYGLEYRRTKATTPRFEIGSKAAAVTMARRLASDTATPDDPVRVFVRWTLTYDLPVMRVWRDGREEEN